MQMGGTIAQTNLQFLRQMRDSGYSLNEISLARHDYENAAKLYGARIRSTGKPFLCHVVGTASALLKETAPFFVIRSGLLHAAYSHGRFPTGRNGPAPQHRAWLRGQAGSEVERLVHAYFSYRFEPKAALDSLAAGAASDLDRTMLLMRVCNEVDDCLDFGGVLGGKQRYRDIGWYDTLISLSRAIGADWSAGLLQTAKADADWAAELEEAPAFKYHPQKKALTERVKGAVSGRLRAMMSAAPQTRDAAPRPASKTGRSSL